MKITVLTLFNELFYMYLSQKIHQRANDNNIEFNIENIRDYSDNKHRQIDDTPYGGGAGMLIKAEPFWNYFKKKNKKTYVVYLTPQGTKLDQSKVIELANKEDLCLISGRYEGIDKRVIDKFVDEEISIGDYVLSSGDLPALVLIDSILRMKEGIIKKESYETDSFFNGLLGFDQYTKPYEIDNMRVPEVLISGHHKKIEEFRLHSSIINTLKTRPDLIEEKLKDEKFKEEYLKFLNTML